uniref:Uncharacterized protein n=2 Tax=Setaria TaxID=4554 RepID=K3XTH4_SETIT|nr:hypothetical protein SEVIR_5G172632v2 [Setaria viridis]
MNKKNPNLLLRGFLSGTTRHSRAKNRFQSY